MSGPGAAMVRAARGVEERFDRWRFRLKVHRGWLDPVDVLPYRGHGTPRRAFIKGRVLERAGISRSSQRDPAWRNVVNMGRRFFSDEIPGARVRARFYGAEVDATADAEGFFDVAFELAEPPVEDVAWHPVELEVLWPLARDQREARARGNVLIVREAEFGVISDLDDTVVRSSATSALKMARIVLLNNAHTRLPFEGVAEFYRALRRGSGGQAFNPIFYVSSSPWNIYDVLEDFMDVHGVPKGPIFLKDWSPTVLGRHREHKLRIIRTLLATYPWLPFVLIGDSGQEDPEIYLQAAREHPNRIRAVYIRDVSGGERDAEVREMARRARSLGTEMVLAATSAEAAAHAASIGLIGATSGLSP